MSCVAFRSWALPIAAAMIACGCSKHAAKVTGDVTLGGKPLTTGVVNFTPVSGGPSAYGNVAADGHYTLQTGAEQSLVPGDYIATVAANATPDEAARMGIKVGREGIMPLLTPAKYADVKTSPLKVTVKAGTQEIDLALEPQPAAKRP